MKIKILAFTACALLGAGLGAFAQTPAESPTPPKGPPPAKPSGEHGGKMRGPMREHLLENLPPEIKKRVEDARAKALQDPKIQSLRENADKANEEFFKAMREKMQEIDPGLGELIKKQADKGGKDRKNKDKGPGGPPGLGNLSEEERQKLMTAREKANADPAVQDAAKKKEAAQSPEDRKTASEGYRKAMHDAMIKADPSIAPLLEKMGPKPPQPPPPGPAGEGEMMSPQS